MQVLYNQLKNKKIAILGFGQEGKSLAKYLASHKIRFTILDQKNLNDFEKSKLDLAKKLTAEITFSKNYLNNLDNFDIVFRSPGIYRNLPPIVEAEKKGTIITSPIKLFFDLCPAKIIGVTGTKGKGTTSTLIYKILKSHYQKVFLGGNIGTPPLDFLSQLQNDSFVILELSSFQLIDLEKSPHVAVILMLTSEHLDWHKDVEEYKLAKESITKYQSQNDITIANYNFSDSVKIAQKSKGKIYYFSKSKTLSNGAYFKNNQFFVNLKSKTQKILSTSQLKLVGEHNFENVLAAILTTVLLNVPNAKIREAVSVFEGLPHRLEFVTKIGGVRFYNDSFSTTPETTIAAIRSFLQNQVLILGGSSKKSNYSLLGAEIIKAKNVKTIILIGQTATDIENAIQKAGKFKGKIIKGAKNIKEIVNFSLKYSSSNGVVLFSPACASFDMFKNYTDRGDQFRKAVLSLRSAKYKLKD